VVFPFRLEITPLTRCSVVVLRCCVETLPLLVDLCPADMQCVRRGQRDVIVVGFFFAREFIVTLVADRLGPTSVRTQSPRPTALFAGLRAFELCFANTVGHLGGRVAGVEPQRSELFLYLEDLLTPAQSDEIRNQAVQQRNPPISYDTVEPGVQPVLVVHSWTDLPLLNQFFKGHCRLSALELPLRTVGLFDPAFFTDRRRRQPLREFVGCAAHVLTLALVDERVKLRTLQDPFR